MHIDLLSIGYSTLKRYETAAGGLKESGRFAFCVAAQAGETTDESQNMVASFQFQEEDLKNF